MENTLSYVAFKRREMFKVAPDGKFKSVKAPFVYKNLCVKAGERDIQYLGFFDLLFQDVVGTISVRILVHFNC